jgi:hypothetical protein
MIVITLQAKHTIGLLHDVVHGLVHCLPLVSCPSESNCPNIPLWMASASLSGISMLNSCRPVSMPVVQCPMYDATNLFYRHNHLHSVQAVKSEVVGEVRIGRQLSHHQRLTISPPSTRSYLGGIRNLYAISKILQCLQSSPQTHLIEVLQQVENATSDLLLSKTRRRSVAPDGGYGGRRSGHAGCDEGAAQCGADSWARGAHTSLLCDASSGSEEGGAEHGELDAVSRG